jgi:hypothetical protein
MSALETSLGTASAIIGELFPANVRALNQPDRFRRLERYIPLILSSPRPSCAMIGKNSLKDSQLPVGRVAAQVLPTTRLLEECDNESLGTASGVMWTDKREVVLDWRLIVS